MLQFIAKKVIFRFITLLETPYYELRHTVRGRPTVHPTVHAWGMHD